MQHLCVCTWVSVAYQRNDSTKRKGSFKLVTTADTFLRDFSLANCEGPELPGRDFRGRCDDVWGRDKLWSMAPTLPRCTAPPPPPAALAPTGRVIESARQLRRWIFSLFTATKTTKALQSLVTRNADILVPQKTFVFGAALMPTDMILSYRVASLSLILFASTSRVDFRRSQ